MNLWKDFSKEKCEGKQEKSRYLIIEESEKEYPVQNVDRIGENKQKTHYSELNQEELGGEDDIEAKMMK